jgi:uncharacterized membrane protein YdjX (TVP38/TMEM64 family)
MLGTFLGMLPGMLVATVFGDQLESALRDPARINYWVVGGVLVFFVVLTVAVRRWLARQSQGAAALPSGQTRGVPAA